MTQIIQIDALLPAATRDLSFFSGETLRFVITERADGAEIIVTMGQDLKAAPPIEVAGGDEIELSGDTLLDLSEGQTGEYNVWMRLNGSDTLLQRGRITARRSLAPGGGTTGSGTGSGNGSGTGSETGSGGDSGTAPPTLEISGTADPAGIAGEFYEFIPSVSGGTPPYTFDLIAGNLPAGLALDIETGFVSGTPTTPQTSLGLVLEVSDHDGQSASLPAFDLIISAAPEIADFAVGFTSMGQSNADGTNALADVPGEAQGVFDRVQYADARHLNNPVTYPEYYPLAVIKDGETVDGLTGPEKEATGGGTGVSSVFGLAQYVADTPEASILFPGATEALVFKKAQGGQTQSSFAPGGAQWNGYDTMITALLPAKLAARDTLWTHIEYAQGEREAELAVQAAETATGVTDWQTVVPAALADPLITGWDAAQRDNRRMARAQLGLPMLPYIFKGMVLPGTSGRSYSGSQERVREAVAQAQKNMARWLVRLTPTEDAVTLTDLAGMPQITGWDTGSDAPTFTDGSDAGLRDDNTYYIDASGYESGDALHHDVGAQIRIGQATKLLLEHLYGAGAIPTQANLVTQALPYFYAEPEVSEDGATELTLSFTASQIGTVFLVAQAAGSAAPTATQVVTGTGALASASATSAKRIEGTVLLSGLSAETAYDIYAVVQQSDGARSLVSARLTHTTAEEEVVTGPTGYSHANLPGLALWLNARGMTPGTYTSATDLMDNAGATVTLQNVDSGTDLLEVTQEIGGTNTLLVRGHASNQATVGRQRIVATHGELGSQFVMAALIQRDAPETGQFIGIGPDSSFGGVRSVFYYANKTAAGGYGTGNQWGLSYTGAVAANDADVHLIVIVSDGAAAGTAADPTTRVFVDGVEGGTVQDVDAVPSWTTTTRIGQGAGNVTSNFDLRFTDLIFTSGTLTEAERQQMEGRMAWDANRLDLLPVGHPYKGIAP